MSLVAPEISGLVVSDFERRYDDFTLGPVSLTLPRGRALGLLGSNGAGKTTFLTGLAGQSSLQSGKVSWNGQRVHREEWRSREQISFVRDVPLLYGELSIRQTVDFVSRLQPTWRPERASQLLQLFQLEPRKRVKDLSRGMKAKLGLLLAASHDVQLLLLDEVTAGIDPDTRDDIQSFLRDLVAHGVTLIVSSHIFEDIERVADEVLILRRGAAAFRGAIADVQRLVAMSWDGPAPAIVQGAADIAGLWRDDGRTTALVNADCRPELVEAFHTLGAARRPASLRDLYFAYRDRS